MKIEKLVCLILALVTPSAFVPNTIFARNTVIAQGIIISSGHFDGLMTDRYSSNLPWRLAMGH